METLFCEKRQNSTINFRKISFIVGIKAKQRRRKESILSLGSICQRVRMSNRYIDVPYYMYNIIRETTINFAFFPSLILVKFLCIILESIPVLGGNIPVLNLLLKFCTSNLSVPPLGLKTSIKVLYGNRDLTMVDSDSCFNHLRLPVLYEDYRKFRDVMMASLRHGSCSFAASR